MKWFPPPSDPVLLTTLSKSTPTFFANHMNSWSNLTFPFLLILNPKGIISLIFRSMSLWSIFILPTLNDNIPHPISTPITFGIILSPTGIVNPITEPFPEWQSGIITTGLVKASWLIIWLIWIKQLSSTSSIMIVAFVYFPFNSIIYYSL